MAIPILTSSNFLRAAIVSAATAVGGVALRPNMSRCRPSSSAGMEFARRSTGIPRSRRSPPTRGLHGRCRRGISRLAAPRKRGCSAAITAQITRPRGCFRQVAADHPAWCSHGRMLTNAPGHSAVVARRHVPRLQPHAGLARRCEGRSFVSPTRAGACKVDPARARRSVISSARGSLDRSTGTFEAKSRPCNPS